MSGKMKMMAWLLVALAALPVARAQARRPLGRGEVLVLLDLGDGSGRVRQLLARDGIGFAPDAAYLSLLREQGASSALLSALASAKPAAAPDGDPVADPALYASLRNCFELARAKSFPAAEKSCEDAASHEPALGELALGEILLNRQMVADAIVAFRRSLQADDSSPDALDHLGIALESGGDLSGAEAAYQRAAELDPDYAAPHCNLASLYLGKLNPARAVDEARKAVALDPADPSSRNNLGAALALRGDAAGAEKELRKAIALDPIAFRYGNLAGLYQSRGDFRAAIAPLEKAEELEPGNVVWPARLCQALAQAGDHASAIPQCQRAVTQNPQDADGHEEFVRELASEGQYAEAAAACLATPRQAMDSQHRREWKKYCEELQAAARQLPRPPAAAAPQPPASEPPAPSR